ncbi:hypothetical protein YC2023_041272 [Brassica napus]
MSITIAEACDPFTSSQKEPLDAPCITKPKLYQGKVLNSQKRMKPDLLYLGEGYPVLRSKHFQGGGYDAVIRSATEPESKVFSLSICEYPTLEGDSSPIKKRPEPKPIVEVKRSL